MKTAEEYLTNSGRACEYSYLEVVPKEDVLIFMKEYAKEVAKHTLEDATEAYMEMRMMCGLAVQIRDTPIKTP